MRALLAEGRRARCLVRDDVRALEGLEVERVRGDVGDPESLRRAFDGVDTVFHLAAKISIAGDPDGVVARTNVEGVRNVVDAAASCGVRRLVHFGSIHARHDTGGGRPIDEASPDADDPRLPAYDRSKAAGEREALAGCGRGLVVVVVEPTAVVGPFDFKPSAMGSVLVAMAKGRIPALVSGGFDWVDARDVARGAIAAERRGRAGERYLLTGHRKSVREVAEAVHAAGGAPPPRLTTPWIVARLAAPFALAWARLTGADPTMTPESIRALVTHRAIDRSKAERELAYRPRPFEETIADTLRWFRA